MRFYLTIFFIGLLVRLIFIFLFNYIFDFVNILHLSTSILKTGYLFEGVNRILQDSNHQTQLFGRIYYQIIAFWLSILDKLGFIDKRYFLEMSYPYHYQMMAIKLFYIFFEIFFFVFIFLILKAIKNVKHKIKREVFLSLVLNPFLMFASYGMFQSDLLMLTFLLGGIYFLFLYKQSSAKLWFIFSSLFLSFSTLIKHLPLLFIPFFVLYLPTNFQRLFFIFLFSLFYILLFQPFSLDLFLQKKLFLFSPESLGLFNFRLNNISIFLFFYLILIGYVFLSKKELTLEKLIRYLTLIICLVYLLTDNSRFFFQFSTWIIPFITLLFVFDKNYSLFSVIPLISFFKFAFENYAVLTSSLIVSLGTPLNFAPGIEEIFEKIISTEIIKIFINAVWAVILVILITKLIFEEFNRSISKFIPNLSLEKITIVLFFIFIFIHFIDLSYRKNFVNLTLNNFFDDLERKKLRETPIKFQVSNPHQLKIRGIKIEFFDDDGFKKNSFIKLKIVRSNKKIIEKKISDLFIYNGKDQTKEIIFPISLNDRIFEVVIQADQGNEGVSYLVYKGKAKMKLGYLDVYDNFYRRNLLEIDSFPLVKMNIIGDYSWRLILENIFFNFKSKPKWYTFYFVCLMFLFILTLALNFSYFHKIVFKNKTGKLIKKRKFSL